MVLVHMKMGVFAHCAMVLCCFSMSYAWTLHFGSPGQNSIKLLENAAFCCTPFWTQEHILNEHSLKTLFDQCEVNINQVNYTGQWSTNHSKNPQAIWLWKSGVLQIWGENMHLSSSCLWPSALSCYRVVFSANISL